MANRIISNASYSLNRYKLLLKHTDCYQRASRRHIYNTGKLCCTKKCVHIFCVPKRTNRLFTSVWIDTCSFHSSVRLCESHILTAPPFAESVKEGDVRWEKAVGDSVAVDEVICEIETDKTSIPVPSPVNGVLEERFVEDGGTVQAGAKLGKINATGAAAAPVKPKVAEQVPPPSESESPPSQPASEPVSATPGEKHKLIVPSFAESVKEGDVRWEKNVGDSVAVDEVVCLIETDKTSVPVPSPISGILEQRLIEDGQTVQPGMELGIIAPGGGAPSAPKKEAAAPSPPAEQQPSVSVPPSSAPPPSPSAPPPPSSSPIKSSAIPVAAIKHAQALEAATVKVPPQDPTSEITGTRSEQRVKMNRMRLRIAQRLKDAQNTTAMLTTFNEVDMSYITAFRKANQEAFQKKHGVKLSFMSAFLKASAYALQEQPVVNAVIDEAEIVYRDYIDISVAVATPKGLVVPVVRNVESMNFADVEKAIAALAEKARKGSLAIEDMDGGTFTISNGGVFGSLMGTPIINPPQSAILGMHGIFERPIALSGQVVIRPMMYIALTYDHRLIDGREAVLFLRKIKACVENPAVIVAGL